MPKHCLSAGLLSLLFSRVPNLHEIMLDRVIAFGHTWSPTLELTPQVPLRHGHAINVDMALSMTIAWRRQLITMEERDRVLRLMSRVGLTLDHELFDIELVWQATKSIMLTRDGLQRAAMPNPIGECKFVNDLTYEELKQALEEHKKLIKTYPRAGHGVDAYVDQSDYLEEICAENDAIVLTKQSNGDITVNPASLLKSLKLASDSASTSKESGYCSMMWSSNFPIWGSSSMTITYFSDQSSFSLLHLFRHAVLFLIVIAYLIGWPGTRNSSNR